MLCFLASSLSHVQRWMASLKDHQALNKGFTKAFGNIKVEALKVI